MNLRQPFFICSLWILVIACGGGAPKQRAVPEVTLVTVNDGEEAIQKGNFKSAEEIFSQLVNETPNDPVLRYYLGLSKDNLNDLSGAVVEYQKALELDANLTDARLNLGLVYFKQNNLDGAITEFTTVAATEPAAADVHYNLAMALEAAGKLDDARAHYEKSASLNEEDPEPIIALGDLEKEEGNKAEALQYYEKAAVIGAGSAVAVLSAAQLLLEQKKTDAAAQKLLSLMEMDADGETLASGGILLTKMKKEDDAIALYKHAVEVAPTYSKTYILLGNALARKGDFAEAKSVFEQVMKNAPDSPDTVTAQKGIAACDAKLGQ